MRAHRYDLQYQLYSLALHRYLRHRLADYDYDRHFGGVIYLFLRGMDGQEGEQGIFTTRPVRPLIDGLDQLLPEKLRRRPQRLSNNYCWLRWSSVCCGRWTSSLP